MSSQPGNTDYNAWRERLATANDPAFWPIEAIDEGLNANALQWWCDGTSALVTRIVEFPGGAKVFEGIATYGEQQSLWLAIAPDVERMARSMGMKRLRAMGRLGWIKAGQPHGWTPYMVMIEKDLA